MSEVSDLVTIKDISLTFPKFPSPLVERPYLLETIDSIFESGCDVVVVQGEEQIGKTVLMAQYAIRHAEYSFTLFIRPFNDLAYEPGQIRFDLCNQINWFLRGETLPNDESTTVADLRNLLLTLQRKRNRRSPPFNFIVDGLADIPTGSEGIRDLIIGALPMGLDGFRVLLSGSPTKLGLGNKRRVSIREFPVSPFGLHETEILFSSVEGAKPHLQAIRNTCRGIPGKLATVKRAIASGASVDTVLELLPDSVGEIFETEWTPVQKMSADGRFALACLAFLQETLTWSSLSKFSNMSSDDLRRELSSLTFISEADGERIEFISESFRRFASQKLQSLERDVWSTAVKLLSDRPDSRSAIVSLPFYLEKSGDAGALLQYLTVERLATSVRETKSIATSLKVLSRIGEVLQRSKYRSEATRFLLMRGALADFMSGRIDTARTTAALAIGRETLAVTIANSALVDEQRLHNLVLVARARKDRGQSEDAALDNQVTALSRAIDFSTLDDKTTLDIATDLLSVLPNQAGEVLRSFASGSSDPNALDNAFAKLMYQAVSRRSREVSAMDVIQRVDTLVSSDAQSQFVTKKALAWITDSHQKVIQELGCIESTGEKIFMGKIWLKSHLSNLGAVEVAIELLRSILADTAYAPSATTFRDLSMPLLRCEKSDSALRLFAMLEGQCEVTKRIGPLVDHYRLRFILFRARGRLGEPTDSSILLTDAFELEELRDTASRATCLAWLLRTLDKIGDVDGAQEYVEKEFEVTVERLLTETAEHDEAVAPILTALATSRFDQGIAIVRKLNTVERRDSALLAMIDGLADGDVNAKYRLRLQQFGDSVGLIEGWAHQQSAYYNICNWICKESWPSEHGSIAVARFDEWSKRCTDPEDRCLLHAKLLSNKSLCQSLRATFDSRFTELTNEWKSVEDTWMRRHTGYAIVNALATTWPEKAATFFDEVELDECSDMYVLKAAGTFRMLLLLSGRAYAGLARKRLTTTADTDRLLRMASWLPSAVERARMLSRVAGYVNRHDTEGAKNLVQKHVRPIVSGCLDSKEKYTSQVRTLVIEAAPMLWVTHPASARDYIGRLDGDAQEEATLNIIAYVLTGRLPGEQWKDKPGVNTKTIHEDSFTDALEQLDHIQADDALAKSLEIMSGFLRNRKATAGINQNQRVHFLRRIADLANSKLPDQRRIQHDGYKILIDAQLLGVRTGNNPEWVRILDRVKAIPNLSDVCYVSCLCVDLVPGKFSEIKIEFFNLAAESIKKLPTYTDRLLRAETMLDKCEEHYTLETRRIVDQIVRDSYDSSDVGCDRRRQALIEMAHRVDEEWAGSLASIIDDDPVRIGIKTRNATQMRRLELRKKLKSKECNFDEENDVRELTAACFQELGALNSTGVTLRSHADLEELMETAGKHPISETYPILMYSVESMCARYSQTAEASDFIRPIFDNLLLSGELIRAVADSEGVMKERSQAERVLERATNIGESIDLIISLGARSDALLIVEGWLAEIQPEELNIVDPYFSPEDLDALLLIQKIIPNARIRVLSAWKNQPRLNGSSDLSTVYARHWQRHISQSQPPDALICIAGLKSDGSLPIHDRWWVTNEGALEFGSSWNSIGRTKVSTVKSLGRKEALARLAEMEPYFTGSVRSIGGEKLRYTAFTLGDLGED